MLWFEILLSMVDRIPFVVGESKVAAYKAIIGFVTRVSFFTLGYYLGGLKGMIFGMTIGSIITYLYLVAKSRQIGIFASDGDVKYSALLISSGALSMTRR